MALKQIKIKLEKYVTIKKETELSKVKKYIEDIKLYIIIWISGRTVRRPIMNKVKLCVIVCNFSAIYVICVVQKSG